jgi:hypothetical protein
MADLMIQDTRLRPTTAIKRVLRSPSDADLRRLQVKWKQDGNAWLANSAARRKAREETEQIHRTAAFRRRIREQQEAIADSISSALGGTFGAARAARELYDSPTMRALREMHNSPTMRAMRELHDSPTMQAMRELHDSPTMRAMRELHDSPTMRAARQLQDSPALQAAREFISRRLGRN